MTDLAKLVVRLEAQTAQYMQQLDAANRKLSSFERSQNALLGKVNKGFGMVKGALALAGVTLSIGAVVKATADAEEAFALLNNAVEASGGAAGRTAQQLADTASALQKITAFDDEAIMGMSQLLLRFQSIQGVNFDNAQKAILDMAAALKMDLASAAQLAGKAFEMPEKGMTQLARKGIVLEEQQQKLIKSFLATGKHAEAQAILIKAVGDKYSGAAVAVRNTFGGALSGLKNAFGDLLEGKNGLNDATKAINNFTDVLNSEETKQGFATLLGGLFEAVAWAGKAAAAFANFGKWIGESFAAQVHGPDPSDLVRYGDAVEDLRKQIVKFQNEGAVMKWLENRADPKSIGLPAGTKDNHEATLANMQARLKLMQDKLSQAQKDAAATARANAAAAAGPVAGAGGKPNAPTAPPPPSEEFTKMEAKLKEQIKLFGETGEAARIAYQIQAGELEDLSPKEENRLLQLARQLDALGKNADAAKETKAAQKALTQNYDQEVDNLNKTLTLTGEVTELERVRFEIAHGGLKGINAQQQQTLENLAKQNDLLKKTQAYDAQIKSMQQQIALTGDVTELERVRYDMAKGGLQGLDAAQQKNIENLAREIDLMEKRSRLAADVKSITEATLTPLEKYNQTIAKLNELYIQSNDILGSGGLATPAYQRAVDQAQKDLEEANNNVDNFFNRIRDGSRSILGDGIYGIMKDGFGRGAKSALESFVDMIDKMVAEALGAQLQSKLFGSGSAGGAGGGWIGKGLSLVSKFFGGSRDSGGRGKPGQAYAIGTGAQPEMFVPDSKGTFYPVDQWAGGGSGKSVTNIFVQGTINQRTVKQLDVQQARRQRTAMRTS